MQQSEYKFLKELRETDRCVVVCAQKGGGKTYWALAYLKYALIENIYDSVHFVCPCFQYEQNSSYSWLKGMKDVYIYNKYSPLVTDRVVRDKNNGKRTLYLLDDSTHGLSTSFGDKEDNLLEIFTQSRHMKITCICILHSFSKILAPSIRNNIDFVIIFRVSNERLLECIHGEFLSLKDGYRNFNKEFMPIFTREVNEQKYHGMIINNIDWTVDFDIHKWSLLKINNIEDDKLKIMIKNNS